MRHIALALAIGIGLPLWLSAAPELSAGKEESRMERTDTRGWYEWAFALDDPTLAEIDLSGLLDAPAGKHGFLSVGKDGHFYFANGQRARFFGTNVGGAFTSPEKAYAEMLAERLAKYGVNLLRLHNPDSRGARLFDYGKGDSRHLDPEALDRYDYFVAQLKKRGIYVYFDLLDYRQFMEADGVRDAAKMETRWENSLKGASIFNRRMIELQKEYATQLLTHKNPYTGLRYVDDPALAVQEITNENSLFYIHREALMLPSYREELRLLWNQWLLEHYGSREALDKAWTNDAGEKALRPGEDPARGNIELPAASLYADLRSVSYSDDDSPARLNAMTRFLYEQQIAYYREMMEHLRSIGLKCPITGTNQDFSDAGNKANAVCDFMARNNYWRHPNMYAKPYIRFGNHSIVRSDVPRDASPIANVASSAVAGKPLISPEFNAPWPNEYRAECLPMMAAYGRLQDWDGLLYFAYRPGDEPLSSFGNQSDPVRWGQVPLAAMLFLRGDISPALNQIDIGVSETDAMATRPQRASDRYSPYRLLPFVSRIRNVYFGEAYDGQGDVALASGHSALGDYSAAKRAIVFADSPFATENAAKADRGLSARQTAPGLKTRPGRGALDTEIDPATAPPGAEILERDGRPAGFVSDTRYIFPSATQSAEANDPAWLHGLYIELAQRWELAGAGNLGSPAEAGAIFRSDTGELALDRRKGLFTAAAPCAVVAAGFLGEAGEVALGPARIECGTAFASISLAALDGLPLERSRRVLVTAVARSENTGQAFLDEKSGGAAPAGVDADTGMTFFHGQNLQLARAGAAPVLAEPVKARIGLRSAHSLRAYALNEKGEKREDLPLDESAGAVRVATDRAKSPWILLEAQGK